MVFLVARQLIDFDRAILKARLVTLNRLMPSSWSYIVQLKRGQAVLDRKKLDQYIHYLEEIITTFPGRTDAQGVLAYCYYLLGSKEMTVSLYEKAAGLKPDFFWYPFNLSALHFQEGNYSRAMDWAVQSLNSDREETLRFTANSKRIYMPIFVSGSQFSPEAMMLHLKKGYEGAYKIIVLSLYEQKKYKEMAGYANTALSGDRDDPAFFHFYLGLAQYDLKLYKLSLESFRRVLELDPLHADALYYCGTILQKAGRPKKAQEFFMKAKVIKEKHGSRQEAYYSVPLEIF